MGCVKIVSSKVLVKMIRFGLCCIFRKEPIKFRRTTAKYIAKFDRQAQLEQIASLCLHNAHSLLKALQFCDAHDIRAFRVNSQILPLKTHPDVGYQVDDLPGHQEIIDSFLKCGDYSRRNNIRTTFHPDQFVLLSSPRKDVTRKSIEELIYQADVADWINADVINIHGGGAYGNKPAALRRLMQQIQILPEAVRKRLTIENDDRVYTPRDLLPVCNQTGVPLVYDVHHHRCLPDGLSVAQATEEALNTWKREPVFHLSSPLNGWDGRAKNKHHDYINPEDFPTDWMNLNITVEVEAKAKELAVLKIKKQIHNIVR